MVEVTILFSTTTFWLSRLIRFFTRSPVSHAAVCVRTPSLPPMILQAEIGGVQALVRGKWEKSNKIVREFRVLLPVDVSHACEHLGDRYDYVGLLGYIPVLLGRWLGRKIKNPLAASRALICSEFVLHLDHDGQIPEWRGLDLEGTTPADLFVICSKGVSFEAIEPG